jgi:hypothetical protein
MTEFSIRLFWSPEMQGWHFETSVEENHPHWEQAQWLGAAAAAEADQIIGDPESYLKEAAHDN